MTEDVFAQTKGQTEGSPLDGLVGEDKKFKTIEDLAKGKLEADSYIAQLEEENRVAREAAGKKESEEGKEATIAELIEAVKNHRKEQGTEGDDNQVTDEDLSKKIKAIMQGETDAQTRAKNRSIANQTVLQKTEGSVEAAKIFLAERAKELGMSLAKLAELGETSPSAFAKLIGADLSTRSPGIVPLEHSPQLDTTVGPAMEVEGHRTKAYYDKLKAELGPAKYWNDSKIQGQYAKDAMFLRDRFNQ